MYVGYNNTYTPYYSIELKKNIYTYFNSIILKLLNNLKSMYFIEPTIDELNGRIIWPKYAKYIYIT